MNELWLVSVPGEQFQNFNQIPSDLGHHRSDFKLPELKVGTLDTLIQISDELSKADAFGESVCRKVAAYMVDILDGDRAQAVENLKIDNGKISPNSWACQFKWDAAKYPSRLALPQLLGVVNRTLSEIDTAIKKKSSHYNQIRNQLSQFEKRSNASLVTRPLTDVVKPSDLVQASEYLETLFVAVPTRHEDEWCKCYETITDMIVPRSSRRITGDPDYSLYSVTLFRRAISEFKTECSKRKFIVREYQYSAEDVKNEKAQFDSLDQEKRKTYPILFKWLKVNFAEAFSAWIHIKALRIFVESVLRYGLPVNFRSAILVPGKNHRKLRQSLNQVFASLDSSAFTGPVNDDMGTALKFDSADYYPYVYYRIPSDIIEMTTKGGVGVHNVVPNLYDGIIKEVISSVKDDFINEGLDESVLEELKKLWNKKLKDSRALEGPPEPDKKRVMYVYMPSNKEGGQSNQVTGQKVVQYRPVQAGNRPVAQVISGTRVVQQHPVYSQQRSQVIRQTVTNDPNQPGTGQRTLLIRRVTDSRPQTNQRNIQRVVQLPVHNQQGGVIKQPVIKQNIQNIRQGQLPGQLDGKLAGSDSSDLDSSDDSESEREEPQPDNEDEPLGSDDDLKDETDAGVFDTDNIVVCQFDKIQRVRNKWRFYLKDGIMHLNGKDYVFQKATGDGEW